MKVHRSVQQVIRPHYQLVYQPIEILPAPDVAGNVQDVDPIQIEIVERKRNQDFFKQIDDLVVVEQKDQTKVQMIEQLEKARGKNPIPIVKGS